MPVIHKTCIWFTLIDLLFFKNDEEEASSALKIRCVLSLHLHKYNSFILYTETTLKSNQILVCLQSLNPQVTQAEYSRI